MTGNRARRFTKLVIGLTLLLAVSIIAGALIQVFQLRSETLNQHLKAAEAHARVFEDQLTQSLNLAGLTLASLPDSLGSSELRTDDKRSNASLNAQLEKTQRRLPFLRSLALADQNGRIFASSNPDNLAASVDTGSFLPLLGKIQSDILRLGPPFAGRDFADGRMTTPAQPVPVDGLAFFPVAREFQHGQHAVQTLAAINTDYFLNQFIRHIETRLIQVDVVNYDNSLLLTTEEGVPLGIRHLDDAMINTARKHEIGTLLADQHNQQNVIIAFRASRNYPFLVFVHVDRDTGSEQVVAGNPADAHAHRARPVCPADHGNRAAASGAPEHPGGRTVTGRTAPSGTRFRAQHRWHHRHRCRSPDDCGQPQTGGHYRLSGGRT
jgi:hypothetical protein